MPDPWVDPYVASERYRPSFLRRFIAFLLDFMGLFIGGALGLAALSGGLRPNGFHLEGADVLLLIALFPAYFIGARYTEGGTIWQRLLDARPRN